MLNWGFSNYSCVTPKISKKYFKNVEVIGGKENFVKPKMPSILPVIVKKGEEDKIEIKVKIEECLEAPVVEKQTIGNVKIMVDGKTVFEHKITAKNAVEKLGFAGYMKKLANFVATGEKEYPETTEKH
jgi:D-alanyl-D-alanine carboxypeptidase